MLQAQNAYLESTGVMVIDPINRTIYAALSQRCDREVMEDYAQRIGYERVLSLHIRGRVSARQQSYPLG